MRESKLNLFFTFWGFDMINKDTMGDLKFTMLGNTATHMPQGLGGLPGMTALGNLEAEEVHRRSTYPRCLNSSSRSLPQAVTSGLVECQRT